MTSPALVAATAGTVAVALGIAAQSGYTRPIDRRVRRAVRPDHGDISVRVAEALSHLAGPRAHPALAVAASLAISRSKREPSYAPVLASIGALALDLGARAFVYQPRPRRATQHRGPERFSYPSGHTAAALAIAVMCAGAIGWSRLKLDEHWIDDVVGGLATGLVTAIAATALVRRIDGTTGPRLRRSRARALRGPCVVSASSDTSPSPATR